MSGRGSAIVAEAGVTGAKKLIADSFPSAVGVRENGAVTGCSG
jgi:hypothetical protein